MLNRTNGTFSADTNRLNLGTRSLDLISGSNIGGTMMTLRTVRDRQVVGARTAWAEAEARAKHPEFAGKPTISPTRTGILAAPSCLDSSPAWPTSYPSGVVPSRSGLRSPSDTPASGSRHAARMRAVSRG